MRDLLALILLLLALVCFLSTETAGAQPTRQPELEQKLVRMLSTIDSLRQAADTVSAADLTARSASDSTVVAAITNERDSLAAVYGQQLIEITRQFGWPSKQLVGIEGTSAAYILFRHHIPLVAQKQLLPAVQDHFRRRGSSPHVIASLADEVRLKEGKSQRYGTQMCQSEDGRVQIPSIADTTAVNARRDEMGLPPIQERLESLRQFCPCPSLDRCS